MPIVRIAVNGAAGRMGRRLVALASADDGLTLAAARESGGHACLGQDAGTVAGVGAIDVPIAEELPADVDVVVDFSTSAGAVEVAELCRARNVALVEATTGLDDDARDRLERTAEAIPLLWAPNMSLAVNLVMKLAEVAGRALAINPGGVDVEIIERHHHFKEDAPSGTALRFGEIVAGVMGQTRHQHGRHGRVGPRQPNEIGYHAVRAGDHPGEHTIVFGLAGESIELAVRATSRDCYAQGALVCAKYLAGKPPGRYHIADVLGL